MTAPRIAYKAAARSRHPQYQLAAVVVKGGAVISVGVNGPPGRGHAEARALRPNRDYRGCDLYVVRLRGRRVSRPCNACRALIQEAGIDRVTFLDLDGSTRTVDSRDL